MTSVKCEACGLVNFADATVCRRCGADPRKVVPSGSPADPAANRVVESAAAPSILWRLLRGLSILSSVATLGLALLLTSLFFADSQGPAYDPGPQHPPSETAPQSTGLGEFLLVSALAVTGSVT